MAMGRPSLLKMNERLMTTISSVKKISPAWIASHEDHLLKEAEKKQQGKDRIAKIAEKTAAEKSYIEQIGKTSRLLS